MRTAEITPARLTLVARPWILGSVLIFIILFMLFLALSTFGEEPWLGLGMLLGASLFGLAFVVFVRRVIVIFDRTAGVVVIRTASLLGQSEKSLQLADIRKAVVETSISRSSRSGSGRGTTSRTHRPVLHTDAGPVPLTEVYSGGSGADRIAEAVNHWLGTPPT